MEGIVKALAFDFDAVERAAYALRGRYPFLRAIAGEGFGKRKSLALSVGNGSDKVLFAGACCGDEAVPSLLLLKFTEDVCAALDDGGCFLGMDIRRAFLDREIVFVPGAMPSHEMDRGAKGAFGGKIKKYVGDNSFIKAGKGSSYCKKGCCPDFDAVKEACRGQDFRHIVVICGPGEAVYWDSGEKDPCRAQFMAKILTACSGYWLGENLGCCPLIDWFARETGRPGFLVLAGRGKSLKLPENFEGIYKRVAEMLLLAAVM